MAGLLGKLRDKLSRTRQRLSESLYSILRAGRSIDDELIGELYDALILADIGPASTEKIISLVNDAYKKGKINTAEDIIPFLKQVLKSYWADEDRLLRKAEEGPTIIMVVGVNGTGKTTSVAKLAWFLKNRGDKVILAAADTFRAAAIEQLSIWAERIGVDIIKHGPGADPGAVVFDATQASLARGADWLIIDTAGRLHTHSHLMKELEKIRKVVAKNISGAPHEVLLVLDATTGQNAINQARIFKDAVDLTGIFLAKLDGTAKGGIAVAIKDQIGIPVKFVGVGESLEDIEVFDPDRFIEAILPG